MSTIDEGKLAKLPKWARDELRRQAREIESLQVQIAGFKKDEIAPTATSWTRGLGEERHYIPEWGRVDFEVGEHRRIDAILEDDGQTVYLSGTHTLHVTPWASNVIRVKLEKRE